MQQGQSPLPAHGRQLTRQSGSYPVGAAQTELGLPPGRELRKMISYPPAGAKSLDHFVRSSLGVSPL